MLTPSTSMIRSLYLVDTGHLSMRLWENFFSAFHASAGSSLHYEVIENADANVESALASAVSTIEDHRFPVCFVMPPVAPGLHCSISPDSLMSALLSTEIPECDYKYVHVVANNENDRQPLSIFLGRKSTIDSNARKFLRLRQPDLLSSTVQSFHLAALSTKPITSFLTTRIPPVGSIRRSHEHLAASTSAANMFVIDADNSVIEKPEIPELLDKIYVYEALNPYNGLVYGHGAPKIFPVELVRSLSSKEMPDDADYTLWCSRHCKNGLTVLPQKVSVHNYATTERGGAITAYPEGYKLRKFLLDESNTVNARKEAYERLSVWINSRNYSATFAYQARSAKLGSDHAIASDKPINDSAYLATTANNLIGTIRG